MRQRYAKIIHGGLYLVSHQHFISLVAAIKSDFSTRTTPFQSWSCWKVISSALQAETLMQPHHWNQGTRMWMCHSNQIPSMCCLNVKGGEHTSTQAQTQSNTYPSVFRSQKDMTKWPIGHSLVNGFFSLNLSRIWWYLIVSDHFWSFQTVLSPLGLMHRICQGIQNIVGVTPWCHC